MKKHSLLELAKKEIIQAREYSPPFAFYWTIIKLTNLVCDQFTIDSNAG